MKEVEERDCEIRVRMLQGKVYKEYYFGSVLQRRWKNFKNEYYEDRKWNALLNTAQLLTFDGGFLNCSPNHSSTSL